MLCAITPPNAGSQRSIDKVARAFDPQLRIGRTRGGQLLIGSSVCGRSVN